MAHGAVPAGGSNQSNEVSPLFIEAGGQSGEGGVSWKAGTKTQRVQMKYTERKRHPITVWVQISHRCPHIYKKQHITDGVILTTLYNIQSRLYIQ